MIIDPGDSALLEAHQELVREARAALMAATDAIGAQLTSPGTWNALLELGRALDRLERQGEVWDEALRGLATMLLEEGLE